MKILLLTTYTSAGGAAIACQRLAGALRRAGHAVTVMSARGGMVRGKSWQFLAERLTVLAANRFSRQDLWAVDIARYGEDVTRTAPFCEADVVHLHWVQQGFLSLSAIESIAKSGKRVVWTMHDAWCATGICHLTLACERYKHACGQCQYLRSASENDLSAKVWRQKMRLYAGSGIEFVTCSEWLRGVAKASALLRGESVTAIPNPLDTTFYTPGPQAEARRELGLPLGKRLILFVAQSVANPYKGARYLVEAMPRLTTTDAVLVTVGSGGAEIARQLPGIEVVQLGYVSSPETMRSAYRAADVLVLPSLSENLPNTIMEAMACGTPAVAFSVGGIPEMIAHQATGYVARYRDSLDLAAGLDRILSRPGEMAVECRRRAVTLYGEAAVASRYLQIYHPTCSAY